VIKLGVAILIQFVNFCVLMAILNVLIYRPLREVLRKRKETITACTGSAEALESQIEEKMGRYQEQLQAAKLKGSQERHEMRQAAAQEEARILGAAHEAASAHVQSIKQKVADEAGAARKVLQGQTEEIAGQIAAKVLGRAL